MKGFVSLIILSLLLILPGCVMTSDTGRTVVNFLVFIVTFSIFVSIYLVINENKGYRSDGRTDDKPSSQNAGNVEEYEQKNNTGCLVVWAAAFLFVVGVIWVINQ